MLKVKFFCNKRHPDISSSGQRNHFIEVMEYLVKVAVIKIWSNFSKIFFHSLARENTFSRFVSLFFKLKECFRGASTEEEGHSRETAWAEEIKLKIFFFPSLLCPLSLLFVPLNFSYIHYKFILCNKTCQGFQCCVSLVGGITPSTTINSRLKKEKCLK